MEDWDDLLDVDSGEFREQPEEEIEESAFDMARSEPASVDVEFQKFNPPLDISDEDRKKLKDTLEDVLSSEAKFQNGACQPETDGDIVCKFKSDGVEDVQMQKGGGKPVAVPVSFKATITMDDFDEVRAHEMEDIRIDENRVIIS